MEQCWWNTVVEQWNSVCGKVLWNSESGTVWCGGIMEQCWWSSETVIREQCRWNSDKGTMTWDSKTVFVEQCGGTVEQCWCNSVVEQWNSGTGLVEQ